jgi:hypothetical protein
MERTQEISGTSLQGYIKTTRRKLTEAFGEPAKYIESKVSLQWGILFEGGVIATIYDWKRYELGEPSLDEEMIYNIGGLTPEAVEKVKEIMKEEAGK